MDNTEHIIQELRSEKWEMAQEIERLREALQFCVEAIGEWEKDPNSKDQYLPRIMFRALRLAQSAIQQKDN